MREARALLEVQECKLRQNSHLRKSDIKLEGYGKNNFIVNGKKYFDPIIVLPHNVQVEKKLTKDNINKKFY